ncbi:MAG: sulfurtransferase complex subunit TusC [Proteobacteria bacterium]|nr:sulfurtransferase complex subunit TusC [Pseudomonadota bacterium]
MSKKLLFMLAKPPYRTPHGLEALEAALVAGVFDQSVSVLFRADAVWHLVKGQDGSAIGQRTMGKVAASLPEYDITDLYVCSDSMQERGLDLNDLVVSVKALDQQAQRDLIALQHAVVND